VRDEGESKGKETPARRLRHPCGRHEVRRGEEQLCPRGARLLGPRSLLLQRLPHLHSDTALTASSSASASTRLPTSVEDRNSSTARLHLPSAMRSRTFHRSFHLPVSFFTSAHRIFYCGFHSGHSLKRWSRVCVW